jgi:hypothetical protein
MARKIAIAMIENSMMVKPRLFAVAIQTIRVVPGGSQIGVRGGGVGLLT